MDNREQFIGIVANYSNVPAGEITDDMKFREDLGFSSLSFMTFLGELEDTFDIELEEEEALKITTVGEALEYLNSLS